MFLVDDVIRYFPSELSFYKCSSLVVKDMQKLIDLNYNTHKPTNINASRWKWNKLMMPLKSVLWRQDDVVYMYYYSYD